MIALSFAGSFACDAVYSCGCAGLWSRATLLPGLCCPSVPRPAEAGGRAIPENASGSATTRSANAAPARAGHVFRQESDASTSDASAHSVHHATQFGADCHSADPRKLGLCRRRFALQQMWTCIASVDATGAVAFAPTPVPVDTCWPARLRGRCDPEGEGGGDTSPISRGALASRYHRAPAQAASHDRAARAAAMRVEQQTIWTRPSIAEPFIPLIVQTLEKYPRLTASRLYAMARERGYTGSPDHFRRVVAKNRPRNPAEAFQRLSTLPGEQAQVDWAHFGNVVVGDARRKLHACCMRRNPR